MDTVLVLTALVLTIVIELSVAIILGYREIRFIKAIVIINCLTNPLLNLVILLHNYYPGINYGVWFMPAAEMLIVLTETILLILLTKKPLKSMFFLSLAANTASYVTGLILFH